MRWRTSWMTSMTRSAMAWMTFMMQRIGMISEVQIADYAKVKPRHSDGKYIGTKKVD